MTENNTPPKTTPSTAETGEIPVVPESPSPTNTGTTVLVQKSGGARMTSFEPETLAAGDLATKLYNPDNVLTRLVGKTLTVTTDANKKGKDYELNEAATAVIRTFDPSGEPVYGDAVFSHNTGRAQTPLSPAEATLLMDAVTELDSLKGDGYTPTPTAGTRTRLLQSFDTLHTDVPEPERELEPDLERPKRADPRLAWTIAGVLALLTGVLAATLVLQGANSDNSVPDEEEQAPVTETLTEQAPSDAQPYDPSQDIENFDRERELNDLQAELDAYQEEVSEREARVAEGETANQSRSEQLDQREVAIAEQEDSLRDHQNRLDQAIAQFNEMQREAEENQGSEDPTNPNEETEGDSLIDLIPRLGE